MQHDEALGFAINQQMFAERLTNVDLGRALGISKSTVSRKVRGHVTWSAEEVSLAAHLFDIPVDALMPTPDGSGGWVPAPYVPAGTAQIRRDPAPSGTGSVVVAGTGFEPATSGSLSQYANRLLYMLVLHWLLYLPVMLVRTVIMRVHAGGVIVVHGQNACIGEAGSVVVVSGPRRVGDLSAGGWSQ